jgi:hypothetical protein
MLDANGFIKTKFNRKIDKIASAVRLMLRPVEFMTDEELMAVPAGSVFVFDVECYRNFFYVAFKCLANGKFVAFERSPDFDFNPMKLRWMLWRFCLVGFNSTTYDIPMVELAAAGLSCSELKDASDFIIKSGQNYGNKKVTPFDVEKKYQIQIGRYNHIDLFNVCPVNGGVSANPASLKLYAGRLHAGRMQDLPFPETHILTAEDAKIVRPYCCNDLANTELLFDELAEQIDLRVEMSAEYGVDLRSKSDAQVAEAVINSELQKVLGYYPRKPTFEEGVSIAYNVPDFIKFRSAELNGILDQIRNARFELDGLGSPIWPKNLGEVEREKGKDAKTVLKVKIGGSVYKLGMGGLHSNEKKAAHYATDEIIIADNDVESFYPRIILNQRLFPSHLGEAFLQVYNKIVETRIHAKGEAAKAKKAGDKKAAKHWKIIADSLKITINGSFGKLGNKYSTLYAPQLMLQVTITGQLVLLMLIEMLEDAKIAVISGNTDGIVSKYHKDRHNEVRAIIAEWERQTNFKTEETRYSAVFSRDVNSYCAIKTDGGEPEARFLDERLGVKTKGAFSERGSALNSILSKNPEALICTDALISFLKNGTSIEKTIKECKDIRRFLSVKNVKGGGEKNGVYLGKVVRWYYPKNEAGYIAYVSSGNKVGKTDGARPVMDLPTEFPEDVNYDWYINEAIEMLYDCGAKRVAETAPLFFN